MRTPNGFIDIKDFLRLLRQRYMGTYEWTRVGQFLPKDIDFGTV
jgi:hypothetical protein